MPIKKPIDKLTDWDWTTLVATWRYCEHRHDIVSATLPADIVSRFFTGRYSDADCDRIAHQFAITDHGARGEEDWNPKAVIDTLQWTKFYRFCEGYVNGYHTVVLNDGTGEQAVKAFHVDFNDRWYPVDRYIASPLETSYCNPDCIVSIDGEPYKKGGEEVLRRVRKVHCRSSR